MLQLARATALAPAGREFAEACMAAAAAKARDPQRIAQLVEQLQSPSAEIRTAARVDLAAAGEAGAVAVLEALSRATDPQQRANLVQAAVAMDRVAVGPLLGMLVQTERDTALKADVIRILQAMQVAQAIPLVAAYTGSPDAERLLVDALDRYRQGTQAFVADENNVVSLWSWCKGSVSAVRYPAEEAQADWMARLALELVKLRPDSREYRQQALVLALDAGIWDRKMDRTVAVCDLATLDA
jgi:hypothetical protein